MSELAPTTLADELLPEARPPVLSTADDALAVAFELAGQFGVGAVERDRDRTPPRDELAALARSGLLGITVPESHGGPGLPHSVAVEVVRRISRRDPSIGQVLQPHFGLQELALRSRPDSEPAERIYADILAGARIGNAFSERSGAIAGQLQTVATRQPDGRWTLNGRKYYATGVLGARWILTAAKRDSGDGHTVLALIRADSPGVGLSLEDWSSFGQRTTFSGTVDLDGVVVDDAFVIDGGPPPPAEELPPTATQAYLQALHAAVDVGIAHAALADGATFVRERGRARPESGVDRLGAEPIVLHRIGKLTAYVQALEALLVRAGRLLDAAFAAPALTDENTTEASLAVAQVKALSQDLGLEIATATFELSGASSTAEELGLDRHWRNLRVHSTHDPARFKYVAIGNWVVNGVRPPRDQPI